jgi:carboxylate-amine ligase
VRPHLAFPTVEIRICDAQPDLAEARSLSALCFALTARIARALDEHEPLPNHAHRLIEENFWRATRYGLAGELIDLDSGEVRSARAHLERLLEWVAPVAEELDADRWLAIPSANSAERQMARHAEGATIEEIYSELVRKVEAVHG